MRMFHASCLVAAIGAMTALNGCSAETPEKSDKSERSASDGAGIRVAASADGPNGELRMNGAPADPKYVALYPNPQGWSAVELLIGRDGVPVTRCTKDGAQMSCTETPFFIELRANQPLPSGGLTVKTFGVPSDSVPADDDSAPAGSSSGSDSTSSDESSGSVPAPAPAPSEDTGVTVEVTDVHGKTVATASLGGGSAPSGGLAPAESTCTDANMGGSPGRGGASKNGTTQACASASLADTPGCDMTTVAAAAKVYCDAVNAQLGADQQIDCSVLTSSTYTPSALPTDRTGGDCSTYWEPARDATDAAGYGSCEKVKLLYTQWRDRARHELIAQGVCTSSPLVLDLDGNGIHLSSLADGVMFDLLGGGRKVRAAWTDGQDAFLALDRNANGQIDGAAELFGNATADGAWTDGFAPLAELDDDGNGAIDARDRAFRHLLVWRDANRDGVSAPNELTTLADAGVRRLSITAVRRSGPSSIDPHGNEIPLVAEFERRDGSRGALVDAFLRYQPVRAK